jgi:hypothetical protein
VASKRTNKLCTHEYHSDRSVAAAIYANGICFVDSPRERYDNNTKNWTRKNNEKRTQEKILLRIESLLGKESETNTKTTAVARHQPARQWTGFVAITWEPQQTSTQQWKNCVLCWSMPRVL